MNPTVSAISTKRAMSASSRVSTDSLARSSTACVRRASPIPAAASRDTSRTSPATSLTATTPDRTSSGSPAQACGSGQRSRNRRALVVRCRVPAPGRCLMCPPVISNNIAAGGVGEAVRCWCVDGCGQHRTRLSHGSGRDGRSGRWCRCGRGPAGPASPRDRRRPRPTRCRTCAATRADARQ